jgi:hypothetical protein
MPKANNNRSSERRRKFRWQPYLVLGRSGRTLAALDMIICLHRSVGQDLKDMKGLISALINKGL